MSQTKTKQKVNYKLKKVNSDNFVKQASEHNNNIKKQDNVLNLKRFFIIAGIFFAIAVVLITVAAFYDWDLSVAISLPFLSPEHYIANDGYSLFIEIFGCVPPFIIVPFVSWVAFRYVLHFQGLNPLKKTFQVIILTLLGLLGFFLTFFFMQFNMFPKIIKIVSNYGLNKEIKEIWNGPLWYAMTAIFVLTSIGINWAFFSFGKIKKENELTMFKFAMLVFIVFLLSQLVDLFNEQTGFFARQRFRAIYFDDSLGIPTGTVAGKESLFRNWWELAWNPSVRHTVISSNPDLNNAIKNNAFSSFPSGHVTFGAQVLVLAFLPYAIKSFNKTWKSALINAILFVIVIMLMEGRIQGGAHFLSDVTFAALIDGGIIATVGGLFYGTKGINKLFATYNTNSKSVQFILVPLVAIIPAMIMSFSWIWS